MKAWAFCGLLFISACFGANLSSRYHELYHRDEGFSLEEQRVLKTLKIALVPGILSESFIWSDHRGVLDFSLLTKDYFGAQKEYLTEDYNFDVVRMLTSSKSIEETKAYAQDVIDSAAAEGKKVLFISHSLGGLALLDYMLDSPASLDRVAGNIFLQSPFYGSPVAGAYLKNPYHLRTILGAILPFVNTSEEVVDFLSVTKRRSYMAAKADGIQRLAQTKPMLVVASQVNGAPSLFQAGVDLIQYGCVKDFIFKKCSTGILNTEMRGKSDGMVPLQSAFLPGVDYVVLDRVDHGETVVKLAFKDLSRTKMTTQLIKMWLKKY